ncbi:ribbon-helix-helix domain-containing protein [Actinokineospora sp. UTMC 2448]|uniref:ribbon-helix-helix domain-containing protein n=1 Tax=Actinokineospora sp. UTMC 2448 TaxID=2268449 RepID=UPI00216414E9|nr:ribbon-helix-helix domain-containing protein [Actinokineospora sp. UTMC 2448]UVS81098.1 Antitoxin MazE6 [Actinokineospora sp. UTMC 2448]
MKTAISVPDDTFAEVEDKVRNLGLTRSEFYVRAARHYLAHLEEQSLTDEIDAALDLAGDDDSGAVAAAAGRRALAMSDDEW